MRPKMVYNDFLFSVKNIAHIGDASKDKREKKEGRDVQEKGVGIDLLFCYLLLSPNGCCC